MGALVLGVLTSPDPEAVVDTSTTTIEFLDRPIDFDHFTVEQIEIGAQPEWAKVADIEAGWQTSMVSQLGLLYLFAPSTRLPGDASSGLGVFRSFDGSKWEEMGKVISSDGYFVGGAATPFGLMALETGSTDGSLAVWRSTDAVHWDKTIIEQADDAYLSLYSQAIGATDSMAVVAGAAYEDATPMLGDRLQEHGLDVDLLMAGWSLVPRGTESDLVLYGPLGIPAMSIPAAELGLTEEEQRLLQGIGPANPDVMAWSTTDGSTWVASTIEGAGWIDSITPAPDGSLLAFGSSNAGNAVWRTYEGVVWEELPYGLRAQTAQPWRGQLVGLSSFGSPEVLVSPDGETWTELGLADYFPRRISWSSMGLATSASGIAVSMQGRSPALTSPGAEPEPVVLERGGVSLTFDLDQGLIHLDDGETVRSWRVWGGSEPRDDLAVDLIEETITFHDETGTELATITFDELNEVESGYWASAYPNDTFGALALSRDGSTWSIQDLDTAFGETSQVMEIALTVDTLVAVVAPSVDVFGSGDGGLQIWAARLP